MPRCFEPRFDVLPTAQRDVWRELRPAAVLGFVLYGGTAVALQLGHRPSLDFDFFNHAPLDKAALLEAIPVVATAETLQEGPDTLVVSVATPSGPVKLSFFGNIRFGRVGAPLQSRDGVLLVATLDDLLSTKLKAMLDRAEAKDYRDAAAMIDAGVSLARAIAAAKAMFRAEPRTVLAAIGYFEDGDLPSLSLADRRVLRAARDGVRDLPEIDLIAGSLAVPVGPCER